MENIEFLENFDYENMMIKEVNNYSNCHTEKETDDFIINILQGKKVEIKTPYLQELNSEELENCLTSIILDQYKNNQNPKLKLYVELIKAKNLERRKEKIESLHIEKPKKKGKFKLVKAAIIGGIVAMSLGGLKNSNNTNSNFSTVRELVEMPDSDSLNDIKEQEEQKIEKTNKIDIYQSPEFFMEQFEKKLEEDKIEREEEARKQAKLEAKLAKIEAKKAKLEKKKKILSKYTKCKTIKDILKRQKELESVDWKKSDKIYPECKLSAPVQWFLAEQAVVNKYPIDFMFDIIYTETHGSFASSGAESNNGTTSDVGLTQQNTKWSIQAKFMKKYPMSFAEAKKLVKYNDYVNLVAAYLECDGLVRGNFRESKLTDYAGCYNGGGNWRQKSISRAYVKRFNHGYYDVFTKHHKIENKIKVKIK